MKSVLSGARRSRALQVLVVAVGLTALAGRQASAQRRHQRALGRTGRVPDSIA